MTKLESWLLALKTLQCWLLAPKRLRCVSVWLAVAITAVYVLYFEAAYRSNADCYGTAPWTRVVVDSPLPGVPEPVIAIGSNAGYVIVVSGAKCKARTAGSDWEHLGDVLLALWRQASGRVRFLSAWRDKSSDGNLPRAVIVPLSRVLCMYDYDEPTSSANGNDASPPCTARTSDNGSSDPPHKSPPRPEERLKKEIRNKLKAEGAECDGDLRISPPVVFRPRESDEPAATAGPDSVQHAVQSLSLEGEAQYQLYVFGYASADGPGDHNRTLSKQRADHVRMLVEQTEQQVDHTFAMGEDHLANGVAESRGARLVACVQSQPTQ